MEFRLVHAANVFRFVLAMTCACVLLGLMACEADPVTKPEGTSGEEAGSATKLVISYEQTTIVTSGLNGASEAKSVAAVSVSAQQSLRHFERTRRQMMIHNNGKMSVEVEYLEGNSDIRIPREIYLKIKDKIHPSDPQRKPIVRYSISEGRFTGYAQDGSIVYTTQFKEPSNRAFTGDGKIGTINLAGVNVGERLSNLKAQGASMVPVDEKL